MEFTKEEVSQYNKSDRGDFLIKTNIENKTVHWLADTENPKNFRNIKTACKLLNITEDKIK